MSPPPPKQRARLLLLLMLPVTLLAVWAIWRFARGRPPEAAAAAPSVATAKPVVKKARAIDPRDRPRGSIEGHVTDPDHAPIARATVCGSMRPIDRESSDKHEPVCVETDDEGHYRLSGLVATRWAVMGSAPGHLPVAYRAPGPDGDWFVTLEAGEVRADVDLVLPGGGVELKGHVKDISGGDVKGARVRVISYSDRREAETASFALTGAGGTFTVWVHPGNVAAYVSADGYTEGSEDGVAPGAELEILLTPESVLVGRVVDAETQEPVAGAHVSAEARWASYLGEDAVSDAEGKFSIKRLSPGRYKPAATAKGKYGEARESVLLGLGQTSSEVTIEVHPASAVTGRVVIEDTLLPCTEGDVVLRDKERQNSDVATVEKDGAARFYALLPGTYEVRVDCRGKLPEPRYPPLVVTGADDMEEPQWTVREGGAIRGKVVDHEDKPVSAHVFARLKGGESPRERLGAAGATRDDGTFKLEGLAPGTYEVEAQAQGFPPSEEKKVELVQGQTPEVKIVLDRGGDIEGTVTDEDGRPVAGVEVEPHGEKWHWGNDTYTRADGGFTMKGLTPGDYRVIARKGMTRLRSPGQRDDERPGVAATVTAGKVTRVRLVVERQSGQIQGRVLDETGAPATDAFVDAERESEDPDESEGSARREVHWSWGHTPVLTDMDGRFTLHGLSRGRYTLRAYRNGGGEALAEHVPLGGNVTLTIRKTGAISGTVTAPGGTPDKFTIEIADKKAGLSRSESFYRTGGAWKMDDLPPGDYEVFADALEGMATAKVTLAEGQGQAAVTLSLTAYATVRGQAVTSDDGGPVSGMRVMVRSTKELSFSPGGYYEDVVTDETGQFEVKRVIAGPVDVILLPTEAKEGAFEMEISSTEVHEGDNDVGKVVIPRKGEKRPRVGDGGGEDDDEGEEVE